MRIDYINGHDSFDGSLWFEDGQYVGHDDQYDVWLAVRPGEARVVELHHWLVREDADPDDVIDARELVDVIPYVEPTEFVE